MFSRPPRNPPQGNQPPGHGGNDDNSGDPPDPPDGPPPEAPEKDRHDFRRHAHNPTPPTSEPEEESNPSEEEHMRPGSSRLLLAAILLGVFGILAVLLFGKGCSGCGSTLPTVTWPDAAPPSSADAGITVAPPPPSPYDAALATPNDFKGWCGGPAASQQFFVGRATGTTDPVVALVCGQNGNDFVALAPSKARIISDNLVVSKSQKIESIFGNSMSYIGPDNNPGAQSAKAAARLSDYLPGKSHVTVRIDGTPIDLLNPLVVLTGDNGGDTFDQICKPYRDMQKAPAETWETEIWSRCRRQKTASNVATTTTIVRYIAANPGVNRDDFQTATARIAALEDQVKKGGNQEIPPQKVDTGVGSK